MGFKNTYAYYFIIYKRILFNFHKYISLRFLKMWYIHIFTDYGIPYPSNTRALKCLTQCDWIKFSLNTYVKFSQNPFKSQFCQVH